MSDQRNRKRMYAMFDMHGHSCRRNVFIYGPKVTSTSVKSQRAKSLAFLLSTMTDMFRFPACIWRIARCKRRTLRGVFLSLSKTKYAFTFEHSVSSFENKNRVNVPFNERNLRDMGRLILEAFGKFVVSSLRLPSVYFTDYHSNTSHEGEAAQFEAKRREDHAVFVERLRALMEGKEPIPDLDSVMAGMRKFEQEVEDDQYSEGGSDSEFSEEDLDVNERRVLLSSLVNYSKNYSAGQPLSNFTKQVKSDLQKVARKKKKRTELEEFIKNKDAKLKFDKLQSFKDKESENGFKRPHLDNDRLLMLRRLPEALPARTPDKKGHKFESNLMMKRSMKRDATMPSIKGSNAKLTSVLEGSDFRLKKELLLPLPKSSDASKTPFIETTKTLHRYLKPRTDSEVMNASMTSPKLLQNDALLQPTYSYVRDSRLSRPMIYKSVDIKDQLLSDILSREMRAIKVSYLKDIDAQKKLIARSTQPKRSSEPVSLNVHNLELQVNHKLKPSSYRPRFQQLAVAKYLMKQANFKMDIDGRLADDSEVDMQTDEQKTKFVKIPRPPPFNKRQIFMLGVFMVLESFYCLMTLSIGPVGSAIKKVYGVEDRFLTWIQLTPILAAIVGYYPTFKAINKLGLKTGLGACLAFSLIGAALEFFIDISPWNFLLGHLIILTGMQSINTAKCLFVNLYFQERNRGRALVIITSMMLVSTVFGSTLLNWLILRSEVSALPDDVVKSRVKVYVLVKIAVCGFLTIFTLFIFRISPGEEKLESTPSNSHEESQLMYQYGGFSIPFSSQVAELFKDKVYLLLCFGTSIGAAAIDGFQDSLSYVMAHYGINRDQTRVIKTVTYAMAILGIAVYTKLFLTRSHQLFYLLINNFILSAFFVIYWFSFRVDYYLTIGTAALFGFFSMVQLVVSLEQTLRYMNRSHSEKILVGTSFYLTVMQLFRCLFKVGTEFYAGPGNSAATVLIATLLVHFAILATAFTAYASNKWLHGKGIDLDRGDTSGGIVVTMKHSSHPANSAYQDDLEMDVY